MVRHFFVGTLELHQYYSAAMYETQVINLLDTIFQNNDYALMTGGSMMYIDAVCNGIDDIPTVDDSVRTMMRRMLEENGHDYMLSQLKMIDPRYYEIVDQKNTKRIVHALEIYYTSGKIYSSFRTGQKKQRPFRIVKVALERRRDILFDRINRRVDMMIEQGLLDEAKSLYEYRNLNSLNTVGYKEMFNVIDGTWNLQFAVERMKKNTRVYAKKQMTWMKKDCDIQWVNIDECTQEEALKKIELLVGK
jgi:tRNA dimethylallyltransferase